MKIYVDCPKSLNLTVEKVLDTFNRDFYEIIQNRESADLVVTDTKDKMIKGYRDDQYYIIMSAKEVFGLPTNVRWVHVAQALLGILQYIAEIAHIYDGKEDRLRFGVEFQQIDDSILGDCHVLVIDDMTENLKKALEQLRSKCSITLANGFDMGMDLLNKNRYDAVLTDCQMPVGTFGAMAVDKIDSSTTVHNGILIIFAATLKGAKCAVVTDANHHQDWVSAVFDNFGNQTHTVNGQRVLFFNNIGKNWDKAFDKLFL